jgi:hypothetical protein
LPSLLLSRNSIAFHENLYKKSLRALAKQSHRLNSLKSLDCFVALLLAMTGETTFYEVINIRSAIAKPFTFQYKSTKPTINDGKATQFVA